MIGKVGVWHQFPTIDNIIIAQSFSALEALEKIIKDFDTIIEIGYNRGGLTHWFFLNKKKRAKIIAYDISDEDRLSQKFKFDEQIEFNINNCFSEFSINRIKDQIETGKRTLLFCDGGNKNQEFNTFAKYLKKNDVIMVHDYFDETIEEPYALHVKEWNSLYESSFNNIKETIKKEDLKKYFYEEFRKCLIGSFTK